MKCLLEFEQERVEIKIPEWAVSYGSWLDNSQDVSNEFFIKAYDILEDWYIEKARIVFDNEDLIMDCFAKVTRKMKNNGILVRAVFKDLNDL